MNMNRPWTPPDNAKILPDMYNVLDAHAAKRTSSMNGVLDYQLNTRHSVISRNRYLAERIHREEKARIANALNKIRDRLPAVKRIRDFNIKFFGNQSMDDQPPKKGRNNYNKSDDPVCRRCYNHHFAIQKSQLTKGFTLPSIQRNRPLPTLISNGIGTTNPTQPQPNQNENETEDENDPASTDSNKLFLPESDIPNFLSSDKAADKDESRVGSRDPMGPPLTPTKQAFGWWMPRNKTYQFLQKDQVGREFDVNKHYTPRLMPYEDWKNIVRDVCAHCAKPVNCAATRQPLGPIDIARNE